MQVTEKTLFGKIGDEIVGTTKNFLKFFYAFISFPFFG
jgi:hypothetical protein